MICSKEEFDKRKLALRENINMIIKDGKNMYDSFSLNAHDQVLCYVQNIGTILSYGNIYSDLFNKSQFYYMDEKNKILKSLKEPYDPNNSKRKELDHEDWDKMLISNECYYTKNNNENLKKGK